MELAVGILDHMIDDQVINFKLVRIKILNDPFRLFDTEGLWDRHNDKLRFLRIRMKLTTFSARSSHPLMISSKDLFPS